MIEKKYTIEKWVELYKSLPRSMKLNAGIDRKDILLFLEKYGYHAPEDYIEFMQFCNGASLFNGKVTIWEIPMSDEKIPDWKSILYMNQDSVKGDFPDIDGVFLIAGNYLGDYIGICTKDKEFDVIYISPETGETWNYYTFTDWLEDLWKEMVD